MKSMIITVLYLFQVLSGYLMPTTEGISSATAVQFRTHFLKANGHRFCLSLYLYLLNLFCFVFPSAFAGQSVHLSLSVFICSLHIDL